MDAGAYGQILYYTPVTEGLRDLNPGLHFDLAGATGQIHPYINQRAGVYYKGRYICAIDRGDIPEFKVWTVEDKIVEIAPEDVAGIEWAWVSYTTIHPEDPSYEGLSQLALEGKGGMVFEDGKLRYYRGWKTVKGKGRVHKVGWRHTFENIIAAPLTIGEAIPGVDRHAIAKKFNVDMGKFPVGPWQEVLDVLMQE